MGFLHNLTEQLNKPIYSKEEADIENAKNLSTTSSEKDIESNYISYDPFSTYTNSALGDQNGGGFADRKELIGKWRKAIWNPEVDEAINEILSEAIVFDEQEKVVSLNLDDLDMPKKIKEKILDSFDHILFMLDFNRNGEDIFKKWYVDGQLNVEAIYDNKKIKEGIQKLRILSPFNIWKIKNEKTGEIKYILTDDRPSNNYAQNIKTSERIFDLEQITQIVSGLWSSDGKTPMSYLQKAIKSINQLNLLEDAVVIWHITRSPEKRVFYIDTGNLPKAKAEEYIKRLISKYRQKKVYNADSGSLESRSKSISILEDFWLPRNCISLDTKISLLDGREVELKNLIDEFKTGKENWTYSVSPDGEIVPGKISWAGITKRDAEVMKVTLDNGEEITATPDHKFILRDGTKVECKDLKEGDSLMPLYREHRKINSSTTKYEYILNNETRDWEKTHKIVSDAVNGKQEIKEVVHHIDMNRYNNTPSNLKLMDKIEHLKLHSKMGSLSWSIGDYDKHCENLSLAGKEFFKSEAGLLRRQEISKMNVEMFTTKCNKKIDNYLDKMIKKHYHFEMNISHFIKNVQADCSCLIDDINDLNHRKRKVFPEVLIRERIKTLNFKPFNPADNFKDETGKLKHDSVQLKMSKDTIEIINDSIKKYHRYYGKRLIISDVIYELQQNCSFVKKFMEDNPKRQKFDFGKKSLTNYIKSHTKFNTCTDYCEYIIHNNHKIAKIEKLTERQDTGTLTIDENHEYHDYHNFALSAGIFIMNSAGRGTQIDTLAAQSGGMESMEHIEYFVNKIYKGLNIPRSRRDKENTTVLNTGIDVEKDELKFFKFVLKLRRRFNNMFIDLIKKDLLAKKVVKLKEWEIIQEQIKFRYADNNPYSDIKKMQILELRMGIAANAIDMVENEFLSKTWIRREILKQTEEEIDQIKKELEDEQKDGDEPVPADGEQGVPPEEPEPEPEEEPEEPEEKKKPKKQKEESALISDDKDNTVINNLIKNLKEGDILSNGSDKLIYLNGKLEFYEDV